MVNKEIKVERFLILKYPKEGASPWGSKKRRRVLLKCEICKKYYATYSFDGIIEDDKNINFKVCVGCGNMLINSAEKDFWSFEKIIWGGRWA